MEVRNAHVVTTKQDHLPEFWQAWSNAGLTELAGGSGEAAIVATRGPCSVSPGFQRPQVSVDSRPGPGSVAQMKMRTVVTGTDTASTVIARLCNGVAHFVALVRIYTRLVNLV